MFIVDAMITVLPIVGLYSQYALIKQRKHIGSFSIDTCGFYILANVLRIMFWFSKGYAIDLLLQSLVVITMTFVLLEVCIQVGYNKNNSLTDLTGQQYQGFWRWNSIGSFSKQFCNSVLCTLICTTIIAIITGVCVYFDVPMYGQIMGTLSIGIQCLIGFPQLYNNQISRSVQGLSIFMIATWFFGDFFKSLYYLIEKQPLQFQIGGAIQLLMDLLIVVQIIAFQGYFFNWTNSQKLQYAKDQIQNNEIPTNQIGKIKQQI